MMSSKWSRHSLKMMDFQPKPGVIFYVEWKSSGAKDIFEPHTMSESILILCSVFNLYV